LSERLPVVLVVDDSREFVQMTATALAPSYTVITATDGLDGYAKLCERRPDVVLLDIVMPTMDGWTVLRKIRSNPEVAHVAVVLLTGSDPEEMTREAARHGVVHLVFKPASLREILAAIRAATGDGG